MSYRSPTFEDCLYMEFVDYMRSISSIEMYYNVPGEPNVVLGVSTPLSKCTLVS